MKVFVFLCSILIILAIPVQSVAQNAHIETLLIQGHKARLAGNTDNAIRIFKDIIIENEDNYHALLALARLYYAENEYKTAAKYFRKIYRADKTDVVALKGLGDCALMTDDYKRASRRYLAAIKNEPEFVSAYFQLAKTYSWQGDLDKAIQTYKMVLDLDETYAEAWQGIGKMLNWQNKPYEALTYYQKAVKLDPTEKEITDEFEDIKNQIAYKVTANIASLNETEENYTIDALIQKYGFEKRLSDHYEIGLNVLLDHSNRNFAKTEIGDTTRWYYNSSLRLSRMMKNHQIDVYGGYSFSDTKFSSYGLRWKSDFSIKNINITNSFNAGYDYFYYWNNVGQHQLSNTTTLRYKKASLSANYSFGVVDSVEIADVPNDRYDVDFNQYNGISLSISYQVLSVPKVSIALNYSYLDYQYQSSLYYSPLGRHLYGPSALFYYPFGKFYVYGSFSYNIGQEFYYENINEVVSQNFINVNNWSGETELGYNLKSISFSIGGSRFFNDYYTNFQVFFAAKMNL